MATSSSAMAGGLGTRWTAAEIGGGFGMPEPAAGTPMHPVHLDFSSATDRMDGGFAPAAPTVSASSPGLAGAGSNNAVVLSALKALQSKIRKLEQERDAAIAETQTTKAQSETMLASSAARVDAMKSELARVDAESRAANQQLSAERSTLQMELVKAQHEGQALQQELSTTKDQLKRETELKTALSARLDEATGLNNSFQQELRAMEQHLQQLTQKSLENAATTQRQLSEQQRVIMEQQRALAQAKQECDYSNNAQARAEAVLRNVLALNEQLLQSNKSLRGPKKSLTKAVASTRAQAATLLGEDVAAVHVQAYSDEEDARYSPAPPAVPVAKRSAAAAEDATATDLRQRRAERLTRDRPWRAGSAKPATTRRRGRSQGPAPSGRAPKPADVAHIPFLPTQSTTPSHSVYGNLQMSMANPLARGAVGGKEPVDMAYAHTLAASTRQFVAVDSGLPVWREEGNAPRGAFTVATSMPPVSMAPPPPPVMPPVRTAAAEPSFATASMAPVPAVSAAAVSGFGFDGSAMSVISDDHHDDALSASRKQQAPSPPRPSSTTLNAGAFGPEYTIDTVIAALEAEFEDMNARYLALVRNAAQVGGGSDPAVVNAQMNELVEAMKRKGQQLQLLKRSAKAVATQRSRSPVRSPEAARKRAHAMRAMNELREAASNANHY